MVILVGCQSRATNGAHTRNHAPSLSTLFRTVSFYRTVSSLEKTCQEFPIHSESIFVKLEKPSLNRGGGLRYQSPAAYNAVLGSLSRKTHIRSHPTSHDDRDDPHPFNKASYHQRPPTTTFREPAEDIKLWDSHQVIYNWRSPSDRRRKFFGKPKEVQLSFLR